MRFSRLRLFTTAVIGATLAGTLLVGPAAAENRAQGRVITFPLTAQNNSGQSGTATLTERGNQTHVLVVLSNSPAGPQPIHIHSGFCPQPGPIIHNLTPMMNGQSETLVNARLDDLMAGDPLESLGNAINVHLSPQKANVFVACGNIPAQVTGKGASAPAQAPKTAAAPAQAPKAAAAPSQAPQPAAAAPAQATKAAAPAHAPKAAAPAQAPAAAAPAQAPKAAAAPAQAPVAAAAPAQTPARPAAVAALPRTGAPILPIAGLGAAGLLALGLGVFSRRRAS